MGSTLPSDGYIYEFMPPGSRLFNTLGEEYSLKDSRAGYNKDDYSEPRSTGWASIKNLSLQMQTVPNTGESQMVGMRVLLGFENKVTNFGLLKTESDLDGSLRRHTFTVSFCLGEGTFHGGHVDFDRSCQLLDNTFLELLRKNFPSQSKKKELVDFHPEQQTNVLFFEESKMRIDTSNGEYIADVLFKLTLDPKEKGSGSTSYG